MITKEQFVQLLNLEEAECNAEFDGEFGDVESTCTFSVLDKGHKFTGQMQHLVEAGTVLLKDVVLDGEAIYDRKYIESASFSEVDAVDAVFDAMSYILDQAVSFRIAEETLLDLL